MFAKYINAQNITPFEGKVLKHNGMISVNPTEDQLKNAGYLPVFDGETVDEIPEHHTIVTVYEKRPNRIIKNEILMEVENVE